jgi:hypothetical protein
MFQGGFGSNQNVGATIQKRSRYPMVVASSATNSKGSTRLFILFCEDTVCHEPPIEVKHKGSKRPSVAVSMTNRDGLAI